MTAKNDLLEPDDGLDGGASGRRRRSRRVGVSIQSKLLLMLLVTSIVSASIVGFIGYQSGHNSIRASVLDALSQIRESQARQLETRVRDLTNVLVIYSEGPAAVDAVRQFSTGLDELRDKTITPEQHRAVAAYYGRRFGGDGQAAAGADLEALVPKSKPQVYLQALYTAPFDDWEAAIKVDDAGDGSAWSAANARFNPYFRHVIERFGFEDVLLLDTRGNVVYSADKSADLGTNILNGPYRGSDLRGAYREALDSNVSDHVGITDFAEYLPSGQPTAWMVSPIGPPDAVAGVMAVQFPVSKINNFLTNDEKWQQIGLGLTGETILVGDDKVMRSNSRLFLEDAEAYKRDVVAAGTPPDVADKAIRLHGTTLVQPAGTEAVERAQRGEIGTLIAPDYLGHDALQAYMPVDIPGLRWTMIAKIDASEAFEPVARFNRKLVLWTVAMIFGVCVAALLLARLFVRPIRRLEGGVERIGAGDYDVALPTISGDEFGDLARAFNEMSRNLRIKEELLNEQRRENDRLMLSLMPEQVAERYRDGEDNIAQDHRDVAVIFANAEGLDELAEGLDAEESLSVVNQLVRQFDAAAESLGMEKVRTLHNGYLACCGLTVPRLDNVRRTVDFALEMQHIVDRFNGETGNRLHLRAGINTGTVTSGLVGRSNLVYDMWGAAVNLVYQIRNKSPQPGIYVTNAVFEWVRDSRQFTEAGEVTVDDRAETVWRLEDNQR